MDFREVMEYIQLTAWTTVSVGLAYVVVRAMVQRALAKRGDIIARVTLDDALMSLDGTSQKVGAEDIKQALKHAVDDGTKGIIFQINSPGGGIAACKDVADYVKQVSIPTVACIRDIGASGGYLIATGCDHIIAHEYSTVGNIGARTPSWDVSQFLNMIGVRYRSELKTGQYKDYLSPFRELTPDEIAIHQAMLQDVQDTFVASVAHNRGVDEDIIRSLANGLPYAGKKAKELGLVDELGGIPEAIEHLKEVTECANPNLIDYTMV